MGGVAVYLAFAATTLLILSPSAPVRGVLIGGFAAVAVGVLDEYRSLPPLLHLAGQITAALLAIVSGVGIVHTISVPTALASPGYQIPTVVGVAFTVFWIVLLMNSMNFLDGLDGLATGVGAIAALLLAAWATYSSRFLIPTTPHHEDLFLTLAFAGALLGFLPFNWHVARVFLGDSGSMFLGLAIASLSIVGPAKLGTGLLILLIPVLDVAWAIVRRQLQGRSFLAGDKQHVYHRMMELGMSHTETVLTLYSVCLALAALDFWLAKLYKIIAFALLTVITVGGFALLEVKATSGMRRRVKGQV
jgi:UDP-GlcNAc:undecaprenyl-phosphate/decaprenyl-phosphate GlcNAc-1-phosphate transferase